MEHGPRDAARSLRAWRRGTGRQDLGPRRLPARTAPFQPRPDLRSGRGPLDARPAPAAADPPHPCRRRRRQALCDRRRDRRREHRAAGDLREPRLDARSGHWRLGAARLDADRPKRRRQSGHRRQDLRRRRPSSRRPRVRGLRPRHRQGEVGSDQARLTPRSASLAPAMPRSRGAPMHPPPRSTRVSGPQRAGRAPRRAWDE